MLIRLQAILNFNRSRAEGAVTLGANEEKKLGQRQRGEYLILRRSHS